MAHFPAPTDGIVLTHFVVSNDIARSKRFYTEVLGGETVLEGEPTIVALANSWIIINVGGGPTDDKPTVVLETPSDPNRVSSFLNIRVANIYAIYDLWSGGGPRSSLHQSTAARRSAATCVTPTATSSKSARQLARCRRHHCFVPGEAPTPDFSAGCRCGRGSSGRAGAMRTDRAARRRQGFCG